MIPLQSKPAKTAESMVPRVNNEAFAGMLHHTVIKMRHPTFAMSIPTLWVQKPAGEGVGVPSLFGPLVDFSVSRSAQSYATRIKAPKMVGWAYDYAQQRKDYFAARQQAELDNDISATFVYELINHLKNGTVIIGKDGMRDETGLYWKPCPSRDLLAGFAFALDEFLNDFGKSTVDPSLDTMKSLLPRSALDTVSLIRRGRAKSGSSILEHLYDKTDAYGNSSANHWTYSHIIGRSNASHNVTPVKRFPRELFVSLLTEGFVLNADTPSEREDATGLMHAVLGAGGLRGSEPLHFWVNDLQIVEDKLIGYLRHPEFFHDGRKHRNRRTILMEDYTLLPRTLVSGRFQAGWKGLALNDEHFAEVHWLPLEGLDKFLAMEFAHYLVNVRNPVMRKRASLGLPDHPYFLVCTSERPEGNIGDPYTIAAARGSWKRAIGRLSRLHPNKDIVLEKNRGTTRHGIRHLYGHLLRVLGFDERFIQKAMHHKNILSSRVYTVYDDREVNDALQNAKEFLKQNENQVGLPKFASLSESLDEVVSRRMGGMRR